MKELLFVLILCLVPDRPLEPEKKKTPDLRGQTNWGLLVQDGRLVWIDGHPEWHATGAIRADGKVQLLWTFRKTNRPAPSVYSVCDDNITLKGLWGYEDEGTTVNKAGDLCGRKLYHGTVCRVKEEEQ